MDKKMTPLQRAQKKAQNAINKTNEGIVELGESINDLSNTLNAIQNRFDLIRNIPSEQKIEYETAKEIRLVWKQHADKIEKDYDEICKKGVGGGAAGVGVGVAVAALGPTAAMGIATTFGVASTGTAISALSGAAATNAALAWLGGGAIAAGGGGMVAGEALLALAGPIGWAIAGVGLLASGIAIFIAAQDKQRLENLFIRISKRDAKSYELALTEICERIKRVISEKQMLQDALIKLETYGLDYSKMSEEQQYELGTYVNLVSAATKLMTEPIQSLQPKYTKEDYENYISIMFRGDHPENYLKIGDTIVFLSNLLYQIKLDSKDKALLGKSIKSNNKLLKALKTTKKGFDIKYVSIAVDAIKFKYVT